MNVRIADLMVKSVMTTTASRRIGHVRDIMREHKVNSLPVIGPEGTPAGIVTSSDLLGDVKDTTPVSQVMTRQVYTVPEYGDPSVAARVMRNHRIHHVVVTNEKKVVGILSAYDLLRLVEDHRYTMKNPPTPSPRTGARNRVELNGNPR